MLRHVPQHIITALLLVTASGCCCFRRNGNSEYLSASQLRSQELFAENEQLVVAQDGLNHTIAGLG